MKKLLLLLSVIFSASCSKDEITENCKTITFKESMYEWVVANTYAPAYYLYLDNVKTKVTKDIYENNYTGGKICKSTTPSY